MVAHGACYTIECAVREDGTSSPTNDFLDELRRGMWENPDSKDLPDYAQIRHYDRFLAMFQLMADDGVPEAPRAVNALENGVWEFKIANKRISFFDTPGDGSYKAKLRDYSYDEDDEDCRWFPDFDPYVRLGFVFHKPGPRAGINNIRQTLTVRQEDLGHDA